MNEIRRYRSAVSDMSAILYWYTQMLPGVRGENYDRGVIKLNLFEPKLTKGHKN
jgi:hypothetical protein